MIDLDTLLDHNDPARALTDSTEQLITHMATAASSEASTALLRTPWWRTPRIVVPIAIGAALITTAGALIVPLVLGINGQQVDLDAQIPIHYTTETGVTVDCTYGIYVGDPARRTAADQKVAKFLNTQNWSGIGEQIYDRAIANPFVPGPNDQLEVDNQQIRDKFSFNQALSIIDERIPADLMTGGMTTGATTNCTGQLR